MNRFLSKRHGLAVIRRRGFRAALVAATVAMLAVGTTAPAVTIDWVKVGDQGNVADTTGFGAVGYEYRIGKFEVTIGQYAEFLNAAAKNDPYGLYDTNMGSDTAITGISRFGTSGGYTYGLVGPQGTTVVGAESVGHRPITYVSWFDAARFANWMSNGQGSGDTETGAYTLVGGQVSGVAPARNPGARFYIPSEDEWYKAAYFKGGNALAGYWTYATQSDSQPGNTIGSIPNQANYWAGKYAVTQSPSFLGNQNYLTNVGAFVGSPSAFGTFDQSGNAFEWNDLTGAADSSRGLRGDYWDGSGFFLPSSRRFVTDPSGASNTSGFRLAASVADPSPIPEIDTTGWPLPISLGIGVLALWERRRNGR